MLADRFWVVVQEFLGSRIAIPSAANGTLVINALDNLTGSGDLISVRNRGTFTRPFTRVVALKQRAERAFRAKEQELIAQLERPSAGWWSSRRATRQRRSGPHRRATRRARQVPPGAGTDRQGASRGAAAASSRHRSPRVMAQVREHRTRADPHRGHRTGGGAAAAPATANADRGGGLGAQERRIRSMRGARTVLILAAATPDRGRRGAARRARIEHGGAGRRARLPGVARTGELRDAGPGDGARGPVHAGAGRRGVGRRGQGALRGRPGPDAQAPSRCGGDDARRAEDEQPGALPEALARGSVRRGCEVGSFRSRGCVGRHARGLGARRPPALEGGCRPHRALHPCRRRSPRMARGRLCPRRTNRHRLAGPPRGAHRTRTIARGRG